MKRLFEGFSRYTSTEPSFASRKTKISVVVVFRNEAENLPALLASLEAQNYPQQYIEVVFCDDASDDTSLKIVQEWQSETSLKSMLLIGVSHGKKACQNQAIRAANNELIACTDADCALPLGWLELINAKFAEGGISLAFGPVSFLGDEKEMQRLEFLSLIGSTMAMLEINWSVMGNAANMAFKKSAYLEVFPALNAQNSASGDDVFFLHELTKQGKRVGVLNGSKSLVKTKAQSTLKEFLLQRIRWASKASRYTSKAAISVALLVFSVNASILVLAGFSFFNGEMFILFLAVFGVKMLADIILLKKYGSFYNEPFTVKTFLILEILNPIYIVGVALLSQLLKFTWKGRKY